MNRSEVEDMIQDLRSELEDRIDDLQREVDELRERL
jgi:uncharacterized protein YeeX (DUF496 family)